MKTMNLKRFASATLTGALALSLAVPTFADTNTQTIITGEYAAATIAVTVPTTSKAIINPFGLDVKLKEQDESGDLSGAVDATISGQKIVTAPMFISNESEMALQVGASVTGTATTGVSFASESAAESTSKAVYVYLQAAQASSLTGDSTALAAADKAAAYAAWEPRDYNSDTDILVASRGAATGENLVTLVPAKITSGGSGDTITYRAGSVAMVRLSGDCATSPRTAWSAGQAAEGTNPAVPADGFSVTVAYTFTPVAWEETTYTIAQGTLTTDGANSAKAPTAVAFEVDSQAATASPAGETVTVNVTVDNNADGITWTVVDATSGDAISGLTGTVAANNSDTTRTFTFTMPAQNVKVNVEANG